MRDAFAFADAFLNPEYRKRDISGPFGRFFRRHD
jgi:hypothetical protein